MAGATGQRELHGVVAVVAAARLDVHLRVRVLHAMPSAPTIENSRITIALPGRVRVGAHLGDPVGDAAQEQVAALAARRRRR